MSHNRIEYEDVLHAAGHRVTRQRMLILDAICDAKTHIPLSHLYLRVHAEDSTIDRSTLYRALKLFVDLGIVLSAEPGDGETYYEVVKPAPHHHLVCRHCGQQQEIDHRLIQRMFEEIYNQYHFRASSDHLILMGLCDQCTSR